MSIRLATVALSVVFSSAAYPADEPQRVTGRILDQEGKPVPGASISELWGANGLNGDQLGSITRRQSGDELLASIYRAEGKMEPIGESRAISDADGRFSMPIPPSRRLMALDRDRRHGSVIDLYQGHSGEPVEARLLPLIRVFGTIRLAGPEGPLKLTHATLVIPVDANDPLNRSNLAICGSLESRFEFLIPPGQYEFGAHSGDPLAFTVEPRSVIVAADRKELDLGALILRRRLSVQDRIERARSRGIWGDYKQNFGKRPPSWHLTDARGVARGVELADFRGRWVVLYFWGPDCVPCLRKQLPELMAFYETHQRQRDRFEILAFCCDFSETIPDIAGLDRKLEPVRRSVWGGKALPFPVLLDNTWETYERFGLEGNGVSNLLLIDPEGKLVEGDLKSLEMVLDHPIQNPQK